MLFMVREVVVIDIKIDTDVNSLVAIGNVVK